VPASTCLWRAPHAVAKSACPVRAAGTPASREWLSPTGRYERNGTYALAKILGDKPRLSATTIDNPAAYKIRFKIRIYDPKGPIERHGDISDAANCGVEHIGPAETVATAN